MYSLHNEDRNKNLKCKRSALCPIEDIVLISQSNSLLMYDK